MELELNHKNPIKKTNEKFHFSCSASPTGAAAASSSAADDDDGYDGTGRLRLAAPPRASSLSLKFESSSEPICQWP